MAPAGNWGLSDLEWVAAEALGLTQAVLTSAEMEPVIIVACDAVPARHCSSAPGLCLLEALQAVSSQDFTLGLFGVCLFLKISERRRGKTLM